MKILDRHIAARIVVAFSRTVVVFLFLFVVLDLLTTRREQITENDVPGQIVVEYYVSLIPTMLSGYQLAALAMLVAGLLVFGAAAQHGEITSMLAAGIGMRRIAAIAIGVATVLTVGVFVLAETVGPAAASRVDEIDRTYFGKGRKGVVGKRSGVFWANLGDHWKCDIRKFNRVALTGEDIHLYRILPERHEQIRANRIYWDERDRAWYIEDGHWASFFPDQAMQVETRRISKLRAPIDDSPDELLAPERGAATMNAGTMAKLIDQGRQRGMNVTRLRVDYHRKFSEPALCFVMAWLAIPFAVRLRRGGIGVGLAISIVAGLAYLVVFSIMQALGYAGRIEPLTSAWAANALFLAIALELFRRTPS